MTLVLPPDIVLGVTHLVVNGELVGLYKCPFCSFKNVHEETITHHIRYNDDSKHDVDVDKLDKKLFIVTKKKESRYTYEKKEDLPLPWIKCPWCDYKDKIQRDVEWHILENKKCRTKLYNMKLTLEEIKQDVEWNKDPYSWMYDSNECLSSYSVLGYKEKGMIPCNYTEYRLYKAMKLARQRSGIR